LVFDIFSQNIACGICLIHSLCKYFAIAFLFQNGGPKKINLIKCSYFEDINNEQFVTKIIKKINIQNIFLIFTQN
jgi:hypothetical protein